MRYKHLWIWLLVVPVLLLSYAAGWAAFGEDIEKPRPEFSSQDGDWIARLTPRGKNSAIEIRFHVDGGTLKSIADKTYTPETHPQVDPKNFRSDFFSIQADVAHGAEAAVSVSSAYFTSATELWGPSAPGSVTWGPTGATNTALADRVNMLTVKVRDGGPLDADRSANGRIEVIVGPRDSFWGYALGTLFIRFFGIFLVLTILMIGMLLSGKVFEWIAARGRATQLPESTPALEALETVPTAEQNAAEGVAPETVAAIALAFHLNSVKAIPIPPIDDRGASRWAVFGRGKIMADRLPVFDRIQKK
jgi:hypothetical protein